MRVGARGSWAGTLLLAACLASPGAGALEKPDVTYKVFQFPQDQIPRIDGERG